MKWPPMPAEAGDLKGVTTSNEHLILRIIIYLCLIYRLFRRFYQAFFFFTRRFLPGVFFFSFAATASRPGLHPSDFELRLLR